MTLAIKRELQLSEWFLWKSRITKLEQYNFIPVQYLNLLRKLFDSPDVIGYDIEKGQIRPGKNGQFDVYNRFKNLKKIIRAYLADLYPEEIMKEEIKNSMRVCDFNPDNPQELAQFLLLFPINQKEIEKEQNRLQNYLADSMN